MKNFGVIHYNLDCKIRYYHNYYSLEGYRYFYSPTIPSAIQIEDHMYIEPEICEIFTSLMLYAWVSAQNCSNILNAAVKRARGITPSAEISISSEQVSRAFILNGLLRDSSETGKILVLPDTGEHDDRLKCAMELRNKRIISEGQKEKMHACQKCEKLIPGNGYKNLRE